MSTNVIMPALGVAQDTGKVLRWHKAEGERVVKGEPLLEIETDKVTVDVEAPASGILTGLSAQEGDDVPVGQVIALIHAPGEAPTLTAAPDKDSTGTRVWVRHGATAAVASPVAARVAATHQVDLSRVTPAGARITKGDVLDYVAARDGSGGVAERQTLGAERLLAAVRVAASPKARRLAAEGGLDLAHINGSGPDGAVLADDVQTALAAADHSAPAPAGALPSAPDPNAAVQRRPAPFDAIPGEPAAVGASERAAVTARTAEVSPAWHLMAERTTRSWTTVPHVFLNRAVEAEKLVTWRRAAQQRVGDTGPSITYSDLLVRLVAAALHAHPRLNASYKDRSIVLNDAINVGIAVATNDGLIVPVLHGADRLGLRELAARRHDLVTRAQAGTLRPGDVGGGTFTVSNLGMYGIDSFNAIVNPPQAAILAVGRLAERVVAVDGQPAVRAMIDLTLSCDHRVVDGARGALFLATLCELIADPLALAD